MTTIQELIDKHGLTTEAFNDVAEFVLTGAAESFARYPAYQWSGADVVGILQDVAKMNPSRR